MNAIKSSIFFCITLLCVFSVLAILHACTISCHNICTHGTDTEVVDEVVRTAIPKSPTMNIPNLKLTGPMGLN